MQFTAAKANRDLLAKYDAQKLIKLTYDQSALSFDFVFRREVSADLPFEFDLQDLVNSDGVPQEVKNLIGAGGAIELGAQASGDVKVTGFAQFGLGFGFDLSDVLDAKFFVHDNTGIEFGLDIENTSPLNFNATIDVPVIGKVGIFAKDGSAKLHVGAQIGLKDDESDHQYEISELDSSVIDISAGGSFQVDLPLFFPTETLPFGGTTQDQNGDGLADNVLQVSAGFDTTGGFTGLNVLTPSLTAGFDLFAILNDPANILKGLEGIFDTLKKDIEGQFASLGLPLVGETLQSAADFITELRDPFLGKLTTDLWIKDGVQQTRLDGTNAHLYELGTLGRTLQDGSTSGNTTIDLVRQFLFDKLGSVLKIQRIDANGNYTYDPVMSKDDIQLVADSDHIQFNVVFAGNIFTKDVPIDFGFSLPGIELDVKSDITVKMDYIFGLGIGFARGIGGLGIYVDTAGVTKGGEEFTLELSATVPGLAASATLGFLQLNVREFENSLIGSDGKIDGKWGPFNQDTDGASGLFGRFTIDLQDSDDRWVVGTDPLTVVARVTAGADVDLDATISIPEFQGVQFPQLHTVFHYSQTFADITIGTGAPAKASFGGTPVISFENVQLDLGEFISKFIRPLVENVRDVTKPLDPIVELLTTPIPLLTALGAAPNEANLLGLAGIVLGKSKYGSAVKAVKAITDALVFIKTVDDFIDSNPGPIIISFGTFELGGDVRTPGAAKNSTPIPSGAASDPTATSNPKANNVTKKIGTTKGSFRFPLLNDPSMAFGLLTGKDVTLFIYDLPKLELEFEYVKSFPIFTGLNARFGGKVTASTNFSFGFDTRGINEWKENNFEPSEIYRVANGFFLDDHVVGGVDMPEVELSASIIAGASLGVGGLVEAGVEGNITMNIAFDLNDNPAVGPDPNHPWHVEQPGENWGDGKLRFVEVKNRVLEGPQCLFDLSGELTVGLDAFLWIGIDAGFFTITLFDETFNIFRGTLASFHLSCRGTTPPELVDTTNVATSNVVRIPADSSKNQAEVKYQTMTDGVLRLNMGPTASKRGSDWGEDGAERFEIGHEVAPDGTTEVTTVKYDRFTEYYVGITRIEGDGGAKNDEITIGAGVTAAIDIRGGAGDDSITQKGTGTAVLRGDAGDDVLMGGKGNATIEGGDGDDKIQGGAGDDNLDGGSGDDVLIGGDGNDLIRGGDEENDQRMLWNNATGGTFTLTYRGQTTTPIAYNAPATGTGSIEEKLESLTINGQHPAVSVTGKGTKDKPWVINFETDGDVNDAVLTAEDSKLDGPSAASVIEFVKHGDRIKGGAGNDEIYAGKGQDVVFGGAGNDWLEGESGDDRLNGDDGDDVVRGGLGSDFVVGAMGVDVLAGDSGNDTIKWQAANLNMMGTDQGSDGSDAFISGNAGTDGLSISGTTTDDVIAITEVVSAPLSITRIKPVSNQSVTLSQDANGVQAAVTLAGNTTTLVGTGFEKLSIDLLDGADQLSLGDLEQSGLQSVTSDLGLSSGNITEIRKIQKTDNEGNLLFLTPEGNQTTIQAGNTPDYELEPAKNSSGNTRLSAGDVQGIVVEQVEQESLLIPTGAARVGDIWKVTLATSAGVKSEFQHTVAAGNTLEDIVTALQSQIDANSTYAAVLVDSPADAGTQKAIKISLAAGGSFFDVVYNNTNAAKTEPAAGSFNLTETPFEQRYQQAMIPLTLDSDQNGTVSTDESTIRAGEVWSLTVNGQDFVHTTVAGDTLTTIAQALAPKTEEPFTNSGSGQLSGDVRWSSRDVKLPSTLPTAGQKVSVTVDSTMFEYTIQQGDDLTAATNGLAKVIDADANFAATLSADGVITVTRPTSGRSYATTVNGSQISISNWNQKTLKLTGEVTEGDVWSVTLDSSTFTYRVLEGDLLENVAAGLAQLIEANADFQATRSGDDVVITRTNSGPAFSVSAGRSYLVPATVEFERPNEDADGNPLNDFKADSVSIFGNPAKPDEFVVTGTQQNVNVTRRLGSSYSLSYEFRNAQRTSSNSTGTLDNLTIFSDSSDPASPTGSADQLDAGQLPYDLLQVKFVAGAGNDRLIGSPFDDELNSGLGDDAVTGGAGVDTFVDAGGTDTLIEQRDWDLSLFGDHFIVGKIVGDDGGDFYKTSFVDSNGQTIDPFVIDFEGDPDPQMPGLRDTGDRFHPAVAQTGTTTAIPLEVEKIPQAGGKSIFEFARISGGDKNNVLVVGDADNLVYTPGAALGDTISVTPWTGNVVLDNRVARIDGSSQSEYYILNQDGQSGGTIIVDDSGGTEGFDELYVFGTNNTDQVYLNEGTVVVGERFDPKVPYVVSTTSTVPNSAGIRDKAFLNVSSKAPGVPVALALTSGTGSVVPAANGDPGFRFKFTGAVPVGSVWTVTIDGSPYSYTAKLGDELLDVARGLQDAIRVPNPLRNNVFFSNMERMTIRTLDGDDSVLSDDTSVITIVEMGRGDDSIVIGTVPQIPDEGNKNLEFPDGVPVADTQNMTNGNSFELYAFGAAQDDTFEVNHNVAKLFLAGGDHDDRFVINTFLVLKQNPNQPDEISNLTRLFGGKGSNRYEYLQNAPVAINGGFGTDTIVINGTPIDDQFVVTKDYVAGAGRIVNFSFIERLEINGAGGKDEIYVLSSPEDLEIEVLGGSSDDIIYLGGDAPAQVFNPPEFKYQPPPFTVQDPPVLVDEIRVRPAQTRQDRYDWWDVVWGSNAAIKDWALSQIIIDLVSWFNLEMSRNPTFRLISHSSIQNVIDQIIVTQVERNSSGYWWRLFDPVVTVAYTAPEIRYAVSKPVLPEPRTITPEPIEVDPPTFALKSTPIHKLDEIKGRIEVDGGSDQEIVGDKVVIHSEEGTATTGTLATETIPVKDGERIQAFDSNGKALFDGGAVTKEAGATPNTILTLSGTVVDGQEFVVSIDTDNSDKNGFTVVFPAYTANTTDGLTSSAVASQLAALVNAHANYNATASGAKITVTGQTAQDVITRIAASVAEPLVSNPGTVTPNADKSSWVVTLTGAENEQDFWGLNIDDGVSPASVAFDFWPSANQTSLTTIARFLAKSVDDYPTLSATSTGATITITAQNPGAVVPDVQLRHALAHGRIPVKATDYRQRVTNGQPVTKTLISLQGLGTSSGSAVDGTTYGGILIDDVENMDIRLGYDDANDTRADQFTFKTTVTGSTSISLAGGDDTVVVEAVNGETRIMGGSGDDKTIVSDASNRVEFIQDSIIVDGDTTVSDDIQTLLFDDLDPALRAVVENAPSVFRTIDGVVQRVPIVQKVVPTSGPTEVWANVAKLDPSTGKIVEVTAQEEIERSIDNVSVSKANSIWSIDFPQTAPHDIKPVSLTTQDLIGVSVTPNNANGNSTRQEVYQTGTDGTFTLSVNNKTTKAIPYNASASVVQRALEDVNLITAQSGLKAEFFALGSNPGRLSDVNFDATPAFTQTVSNINFARTTKSFWATGPDDKFAVKLTGSIFIPETGTYSFSLTSDDGSILFLDGLPIVNNDGLHADAKRVSVQRSNLEAGAHSFEVRMFENTGAATLIAKWTGPSFSDQVIPSSAFKSSIAVTGSGTLTDPWMIQTSEALPTFTADSRNLQLSSISATHEIQTISTSATQGQFTLLFRGEETNNIPHNASAAELKSAIEALSSIETVTVTGEGTVTTPWRVTFTNPGFEDVPQLIVGPTSEIDLTISTVQSPLQTQTLSSTAIGGTFSLTHDGYTTRPIAFNADASVVQQALEELTQGKKLYFDAYGNRSVDSGNGNSARPVTIPVFDSEFIPLKRPTADSPITQVFSGFNDELEINDSGGSSPVDGKLTPTDVLGFTPAGEKLSYSGLENVTITLGDQQDAFEITDTAGGGSTINTGGGDDVVNVLSLSGQATVTTINEGRRASNEVQRISVGSASGGQFTLSLDGQTTGPFNHNATATDVKNALEQLSNVTEVVVVGTGNATDPWRVTFVNPGLTDVDQLVASSTSLVSPGSLTVVTENAGRLASGNKPATREVQAIRANATAGQFTLTFENQTTSALNFNASAGQVETALEQLSTITDVEVTGTGRFDDPWRVAFIQPAGNVSEITATPSSTFLTTGSVTVETENNGNAATDEMQSIVATAAAGTFALTLDGRTTAPIAYNAPATGNGSVESALEALSGVQVDVTGAGTDLSPWKVTFTESGLRNVSQLNVDDSGLASSNSATVTTLIEGGPSINETQSLFTDASSGTFTLDFAGQTTAPIAHNATAAQLKTALETLSTITTVLVTGSGVNADPWQITFVAPGNQDVSSLTADSASLVGGTAQVGTLINGRAAANEIQSISKTGAAPFVISLSGRNSSVLAHDATAAEIETAIESLGDFTVDVTGAGTTAMPWRVEFTNPAATNIPPITIDIQNTTVTTVAQSTFNVDEVQSIARDAAVNGGNFTLSFDGLRTTPVAWNASSTDIQSAINSLGGIAVSVTGTGSQADPWLITFTKPNVKDVPKLQIANNELSAPASAVVSINTQDGSDTVNVGVNTKAFTNNTGKLANIKGALSVNGGANVGDVLNVDDTSNTDPNTGVINATQLTQLFGNLGVLNYVDFAELNVGLGSGGNTLHVQSTHSGSTNLATGTGADLVEFGVGADTVATTPKSLNQINGPVTVDGGTSPANSIDQVILNDATDTSDNSGVFKGDGTGSGSVTGFGINSDSASAGISLSGIEFVDAKLGAGNGSIEVQGLASGTRILSGPGNDQFAVRLGTAATLADDQLLLDGQSGSDEYTVHVADAAAGLVSIADSGSATTDQDKIIFEGTDQTDRFLFRSFFVAVMYDFDDSTKQYGSAQRVNYTTAIEGLTVNGNDGDDFFTMDNNGTTTTLNGDDGKDVFQFGQLFDSPRDIPNVAAGDEEQTLNTTRGFVTRGPSRPTAAFGGLGDDVFVVFHNTAPLVLEGNEDNDAFTVRAFILSESGKASADQQNTKINADAGADRVEYAINAPVSIDGGDGLDSVVVIGTEAADDFAITDQGIFGAGLFITFVGVEQIEVDGDEGDDRFYVMSTTRQAVTRVVGGFGNDEIHVGETAPTVVSQGLDGHTGLIEHQVNTSVADRDATFDNAVINGIAAKINDNEVGQVVRLETQGTTRVIEGGATDTYDLMLSMQPLAAVNVTVTVAGGSTRRALVSDDGVNFADSVTVTIGPSDWDMPHTISVKADDDNVAEGEQSVQLLHTLSGDLAYKDVQVRPLVVTVIDDDAPGLLLTPTDTQTQVSESGVSDSYSIQLTKQPTAPVTVLVQPPASLEVSLGGQTGTAAAPLQVQFTSATWNQPQTISVTAVDDTIVTGAHVAEILHSIDATAAGRDTTFDAVSAVELPVSIADNDVAGVTITETLGSTQLAEGGATDKYTIVLDRQPTADVTIDLKTPATDIAAPDPTVSTVTQGEPPLIFTLFGFQIPLSFGNNETQFIDTNGLTDMIQLTFRGEMVEVPGQALPSVVQSKLESLSTVGMGNVSVSGSAGEWNVEFVGTLGLLNVPPISAVSTNPGRSKIPQVALSQTQVVFTPQNWNTPQEITVTAIDDAIIDGDKLKSFASMPRELTNIRGPLLVRGGLSDRPGGGIPDPVFLPTESNPTQQNNPNPPQDESNSVDRLFVSSQDSLADGMGRLIDDRIEGLGMGGDVTIDGKVISGGIRQIDVELTDINLGRGNDTLEIVSLASTTMNVNSGPGDDLVRFVGNGATVGGQLTVDGGDDNDKVEFVSGDIQLGGKLTVRAEDINIDTPVVVTSSEAESVVLEAVNQITWNDLVKANGATKIRASVSQGAIVDSEGDKLKIQVSDAELTAATGIGSLDNGLETQVGLLTATTTQGNTHIINTGPLVIDQIGIKEETNLSTGDVILSSTGSVTRSSSNSLIRGNQISLMVQPGGVGTSSEPVLVDTGTAGLKTLADADIWITESAGNLPLLEVESTSDSVTLTSGGDIVDVSGDAAADVIGTAISLVSNSGGIGSSDNTIEINQSERFNAAAQNDVWVSEIADDLRIGLVTSTIGDVQLTAAMGMLDIDDDAAADVVGRTLNLTANDGPIGAADNRLDIDSSTSAMGTVSATSPESIWLNETDGTMFLGKLTSTNGTLFVTGAGSIEDDDDAGAVDLDAPAAVLTSAGTFGTSENPVESQLGRLEVVSGGGVYLNNQGALRIGAITPLSGVSAQEAIDITTTTSLSVEENVVAQNGVLLTVTDTASSNENIVVSQGATIRSDSGNTTLRAGDDITIAAGTSVTAPAGSVVLQGDAGNADADGTTISIEGDVEAAVTVTALGGADSDTISLNQLNLMSSVVINGAGGSDTGSVTATSITNAPSDGLLVESTESLTITDSSFNQNGRDGIRITNGDNPAAEGSVVIADVMGDDNGEHGIHIQGIRGQVAQRMSSFERNAAGGVFIMAPVEASVDSGTHNGIMVRQARSVIVGQMDDVNSTGPVDIEATDAVTIRTNLDANNQPVRILANQDGTGNDGFVMEPGTSIRTTDDGPNAVSINVNSMLGGSGDAVITTIDAGTSSGPNGGRVTISTSAGRIIDGHSTATNVIAGNTVLLGGGGVGTSDDPIETEVARAEGTGGTAGFFVENDGGLIIGGIDMTIVGVSAAGDVTVLTHSPLTIDENVTAGGNILLQAGESPATGDNLTVSSAVTVMSTGGNITLNAGDDLTLFATSVISAAQGSIDITSDFADADPGIGTTQTIAAQLISTGTSINAGMDNDLINFFYPNEVTNVGTVTLSDSGGNEDNVIVNGSAAGEDLYLTTTEPPTTSTTEQATRFTTTGEPVIIPASIESVTVAGGAGNDNLHIQPSRLWPVHVDGQQPQFGDPEVPPGDIVFLDTFGNNVDIERKTFTVVSPTNEPFQPVSVRDVEGVDLIPISSGPVQRYDFNSTFSGSEGLEQTATQSGYLGVTADTLYSTETGYGWDRPLAGTHRDSTTGPVASLISDAHIASLKSGADRRTFTANVENGWLLVTVTVGGAQTSVSGLQIENADDGTVLATNVSATSDGVFTVSFPALVKDGTLDLQFSVPFGPSRTFAVAGVDIRPAHLMTMGIPIPSTLNADGVTIDTFTLYEAPPNSPVTVETTLGTLVGSDASPSIAGFQVLSNGQGQANFSIRRPSNEGQALVTFSSPTGQKTGCVLIDYGRVNSKRFDFNTNQSATFNPATPAQVAGYLPVLTSDLYTEANGYGWLAEPNSFEITPGTHGALGALLEDGHRNSSPGTFRVAVDNGMYQVHVAMGDGADHQALSVSAEGIEVVPRFNLGFQKIFESNFLVTVSDGLLDLTFQQHDSVFGDPHWVVNAIEIYPVSLVQGMSLTSNLGSLEADGTTTQTINATTTLAPGTVVSVSSSLGAIVSADVAPDIEGSQVLVAGNGTINFDLLAPTRAGVPTLEISSIDGSQSLSISDPAALEFVIPTTRQLDFNGTRAASKQSGFVGVTNVPFDAADSGFGWLAGTRSFDGTATQSPLTNLLQDGHSGLPTASSTFVVEVDSGTDYDARVYVGHPSRDLDFVTLQAEGAGTITVPATLLGASTFVTFFDANDVNGDGLLELTVTDTGGLRTGWALNGLEIAESNTGLPASAPLLADRLLAEDETHTDPPVLGLSDLRRAVLQATDLWAELGLTPAQQERLDSVKFAVADLGEEVLGLAGSRHIVLDDDAGGFGWHVDSDEPDEDRFDLLSAVAHELGHVIGLAHDFKSPHSLMSDRLKLGERQLDDLDGVDSFFEGVAHEGVPLT